MATTIRCWGDKIMASGQIRRFDCTHLLLKNKIQILILFKLYFSGSNLRPAPSRFVNICQLTYLQMN